MEKEAGCCMNEAHKIALCAISADTVFIKWIIVNYEPMCFMRDRNFFYDLVVNKLI